MEAEPTAQLCIRQKEADKVSEKPCQGFVPNIENMKGLRRARGAPRSQSMLCRVEQPRPFSRREDNRKSQNTRYADLYPALLMS